MTEEQDKLKPGSKFPAELKAPERSDIWAELSKFGIQCAETIEIKLIDSTHDAADIRLNYIIGKKWVLRFCIAPDMTEKRMGDLNRLIGRYQAFGLKCPAFIADSSGKYLHQWNQLLCYLSEYIDLPLASEVKLQDEDQFMLEVAEAVARFAEAYRDVDLSETMGMYSLFDLSPFDIPNGIDEKQNNFNQLIRLLRDDGSGELADRLELRHGDIRRKLKAVYKELPRCVFQADENDSNVLIDDGQHVAGFIDFNLAGTEVIINQLVNLASFDYDMEQLNPKGAAVRLESAIRYFQAHIGHMLQAYHATDKELQAGAWYAWISLAAQWPHFCFFRKAIMDGGPLKQEIYELLSLIADLPEVPLLPTGN